VRQVLTGHEPYPAAAVDRHWNLVEANSGIALMTADVDVELLQPPPNAMRLALHPGGLAPRITNLGEWRAHLLSRLRRQVALTADPVLSDLLDEVRAYPCHDDEPDVEIPAAGEVFVPLRLRHNDAELTFFSTVTTFGTPLDVTVSELAIESFFPADAATSAALRG
jgi:MmyB-like transcription regulator ligand binding domain